MSNLEKINVLTKEKLDSLDLTQYKNQLFGTTDDTEDKAIAFAESERQKSETDGAIVHEKDNPHPLVELFTLSLNANNTMTFRDGFFIPFDNVPNNEYFETNTEKNKFTALKDCKIKINGIMVFKDPSDKKVDMHIAKNNTKIHNCFVQSSTVSSVVNNMFFEFNGETVDLKKGDYFGFRPGTVEVNPTATLTAYYTRVNVEVFKS